MAETILESLGVDFTGGTAEALDDRLWGMIDREIDNGGEALATPGNTTPQDQTVINTSDNQTGTSKVAGTGDSMVRGVDNRVIYGLGALVVLGLSWALLK